MPERSTIKRWLSWAWKVPLALVLSLVLLEAFLRMPPFRVGVSPVTYHPVLGYWHKPGYRGEAFSACYSVAYSFDQRGLRPSRAPVAGRKAIVTGDSQIDAVMVPDELVLHQRLQARLGDRIEVLNYGLVGSGADLQYVALQNLADLDGVGWVVQLINLDTDIYEADARYAQAGQRPRVRIVFDDPDDLDRYRIIPPGPFTWGEQFREKFSELQLYSYSRAALLPVRRGIRLLRRMLPTTAAPDGAGSTNAADEAEEQRPGQPSERAWTNLLGAIRLNQQAVESHGGRYLPLVWSRQPGLFEAWIRRSAPLGIETTSLAAMLAADGADLSRLTYRCDAHFLPATHNRIAKVLVESGFFDQHRQLE